MQVNWPCMRLFACQTLWDPVRSRETGDTTQTHQVDVPRESEVSQVFRYFLSPLGPVERKKGPCFPQSASSIRNHQKPVSFGLTHFVTGTPIPLHPTRLRTSLASGEAPMSTAPMSDASRCLDQLLPCARTPIN